MAMTWDAGRVGPHTTLSSGNLVATEGTTTNPVGEGVYSSIALTGTGVIGVRGANTLGDGFVIGIANSSASASAFPGTDTNGFAAFNFAGQIVWNGGLVAGSVTPTWSPGDLVEMNYDVPGQQCRFRVNGGTYSAYQSWAGKVSGAVFLAAGYFDAGQTLTLVSFPQTLNPALFTNSSTFFAPTVTSVARLTPSLFTNTATFYAATATPGAVSLLPSLFSNTNAFYAPTVSQGGSTQTLTPALFSNTNAFYGPTVSVGAVTLSPSLFTNSSTFYAATVSRGTVTLTPALFTNTSTFYGPTVIKGAVTLSPGLFANSNTFYAPTVAPGAVTLSPGLFANVSTFYPPAVIQPGGLQTLLPSIFTNASVFYPAAVNQNDPPGTYPLAIEGNPTTIRRSLTGGGSVVAGSIPSTGRVIASALRGRP